MKITFIHPDLGIGGAERLVLDVAEALQSQNHEVKFITNHFDSTHAFDELKNNKFPVEVYGDWLPRSLFGKCQALCAYIRMIYLSLVYICFCEKTDLHFVDLIPISIPFLKLTNKKVIYYCHHPDLLASPPGGTLKKLYRAPIDWLELKATAMADVILVNSEYTRSIFRETFPEIKKSIEILYPTIAFSYQEKVNKRKTPEHISDVLSQIDLKAKTVFLSVNRFHPAKKLEFAVLGMEKLKTILKREEWENTFCIIAGGYDPQSRVNEACYNELVNLTKEKGLQDKIIFLKSPSDDLKVDLLTLCSCLLYTPLKEHFGIVPLEAMLASKPVIALNSGGPRETVDHGKTGYLCEPTADSMGHFMYQIVQSNVSELGIKGKARLEEKFSYKKFAEKINSVVLKTVVDSKKQS